MVPSSKRRSDQLGRRRQNLAMTIAIDKYLRTLVKEPRISFKAAISVNDGVAGQKSSSVLKTILEDVQ